MNKQTDYTPWALAIHKLNLKGTGKIPKNQLDLLKKNNSMQIPLINKNTFFFLEKRVIFITGMDEHGKKIALQQILVVETPRSTIIPLPNSNKIPYVMVHVTAGDITILPFYNKFNKPRTIFSIPTPFIGRPMKRWNE